MGDWRTGVYLTTRELQDDPDQARRLRDGIGLDTAVLSFSGTLPPEVLAKTPFPAVPPTEAQLAGLVIRHMDGAPVDPREYDRAQASAGPGVRAGGDDEAFRRAVEALHADGLEVWLCGGTWTERRLMFCPSREGVTAWLEAVCAHWASAYGVDGIDLTHARFPMGSFPLGLFACTCASCAAAAQRLGYDLGAMVEALRAARRHLRQLDGARLGEVARMGLGVFDVVQALGLSGRVIDWLRFRAELLCQALGRCRVAAHAAAASAGTRVLFGSDTFPASMSLTVGHDHRRWAEVADFASPLVSHISAFTCNTLVEWARFLEAEVGADRPGATALSAADALTFVYRITGYDGIGLPETFAYIDDASTLAQRIRVDDLVLRDLAKARLLLPADMPCYPIVHGSGWPRAAIDRILTEARRLGHDGIIWQGTDELLPAT